MEEEKFHAFLLLAIYLSYQIRFYYRCHRTGYPTLVTHKTDLDDKNYSRQFTAGNFSPASVVIPVHSSSSCYAVVVVVLTV